MTTRPSARRGFTLVELLVVIGIIAILISVLLPVLGNARRSANSVKCLSNMRNLHNALLMYAGDFKNATPVARQDDWDPKTRVAVNQNNRYWIDMLYPYVVRKSASFPAFASKADADAFTKSILWCPSWFADNPQLDVWTNYTDRFKNGYGLNMYLGFRPDYPNPDAMLPFKQQAMWSAIWGSPAGTEGKYYKRGEIVAQAERVIIADANLWLIGLKLTNTAGDIEGQIAPPLASEHSQTAGGPGAINYDRYRHGKYPKISGARFAVNGGSVVYNVLYVDGHAATLNSIKDGYKAIRMRYP